LGKIFVYKAVEAVFLARPTRVKLKRRTVGPWAADPHVRRLSRQG